MDSVTIKQLLKINDGFYREHGEDFSSTRRRLQPGVQRVLETLQGGESILDLGCGNGELARTLSRRGHRGPYLGLDFSRALLDEAEGEAFSFPVQFLQIDLTQFSVSNLQSSVKTEHWSRGIDYWSLITAFAVLHHIPGRELRLKILTTVHELLEPAGYFIHSNWQFLNSPHWRARVRSWDSVGIRAAAVESGDYLLDWRHGKVGLRYVHPFDAAELEELANESGFETTDAFCSDGENRKMSLYQIWKKVQR